LDHDWTPEQVDRLDPDFVNELVMAKQARADRQLFSIKDPDKDQKAQQTRRKVELTRLRDQERKR